MGSRINSGLAIMSEGVLAKATDGPSPSRGAQAGESRDRAAVLFAVIALTLASWTYLLWMERDTVSLRGTHGPHEVMSCCGVNPTLTLVMWVVMMVGMMLPSAAPMILAFATVARRRGMSAPLASTSVFLAGYLIVWTVFSAVAAGGQWALYAAGLLNPHEQTIAAVPGGIVLIVTGLFQLTPAKSTCLGHCRSAHAFVEREWRKGTRWALASGLRHGLFCAGSCAILMAVLFVFGVMNLVWIGAITLFVLGEKVLPWKRAVVRVGAALCFAAGIAMITHALWA